MVYMCKITLNGYPTSMFYRQGGDYGRVCQTLAVWLPEEKVSSYKLLVTNTSSSIEQIYLTKCTAL